MKKISSAIHSEMSMNPWFTILSESGIVITERCCATKEIVEYDGRGITPPDQLPKDAPKSTEEAV